MDLEIGEAESSSGTSPDVTASREDDDEKDAGMQPTCGKPLSEPHVCSDSEGFSDSSINTTGSENVMDENTLPKRRRKRKSFLAYQRRRKTKTVGFLRIDDGVEDKADDDGDDEQSDSDESQDETSGEISGLEDIEISDLENDDMAMLTSTHSHTEHEPSDRGTAADTDFVLDSLIEKLTLLLPAGWTVDVVKENIIRIFTINESKNPSVPYSIFYDSQAKSVGLFVHGIPVPRNHQVFKNTKNNICLDCRHHIKKFEREQKKREKGELDPSSIPDKYLTKEGMKAKKNKFRILYREEKKRADRLEKRLESLKIKLHSVLSDEFSAILRVNQHRMTPLQKLFWEDQMKVLALDDKRGMRWHPMLIRLALHLHSLSDFAYEFINDTQVFTFPSSRRLYDYSHFVEATEGCQAEITNCFREKIRKSGEEDHFSYINLMFDEMNIRSGLVFSRTSGELIGFTKLSGVEEELALMESELKCKKIQTKTCQEGPCVFGSRHHK
ncbi:Polycomb protein Asx [Frankliniella fusca]|uniref:Polycomb protein Asx n=1 Tax=Frankliniella fusca TaxID=407009 RepID=A0AAE1LJ31_9NEOP|nr:Polycomb protein Asx [Frankliniella fusca]